jgi:hypothetical protein
MAKVKACKNGQGRDSVAFECPGCGSIHFCPIDNDGWKLTGTDEKPTLRPSVRTMMGNDHRCHLYITDGEIQYLGDCDHDMAGKTVPMRDVVLPGDE